jgi:outer membrane protein
MKNDRPFYNRLSLRGLSCRRRVTSCELVLLLGVFLVIPTASRGAEPLSLAQAVAKTLAKNPDLAVDDPGIEAARADVKAANATYRPRVDYEFGFNGGNNPVYVFGTLLTQQRFTAANFALPSLNEPDPLKNLQNRFSVQQNVWDFGRSRQRTDGARLGLEMSERGKDEHVRQVLLGVVDAYYSLALAREAWLAAQAAVRSSESLLEQARNRVAAGLTVEADQLRGQALLADARQREIEARGRIDIARAYLNRLMGEPFESAEAEPTALTPVESPLPTEEALRTEQKQRRPDYQLLAAQVRQGELETQGRRAEYLPTLGAFASWEADNPAFNKGGGTNWMAGLSFRWNIYAGGSDAARLEAARQRFEQKRRQLAALESGMALELHRAIIDFRTAQQQVEAARAAEAQAEEGLRILKNRYEAGLATMTDLLSAEAARAGARTTFAEAVYRHRVSFARLEYTAGTLSPTSRAVNP